MWLRTEERYGVGFGLQVSSDFCLWMIVMALVMISGYLYLGVIVITVMSV